MRKYLTTFFSLWKDSKPGHRKLLLRHPKEIAGADGVPRMSFGWMIWDVPEEDYWSLKVSRDLGAFLDGTWVAWVALVISIIGIVIP